MKLFNLNRFTITLSSVLLLLLGSCVKETMDDVDALSNVQGVQTNFGLSLPLIDASVGIKDIYSSSTGGFIREEGDQSFTLVYNKEAKMPQGQFVKIPPFEVSYNLNVDAGTAIAFNNLGSFSNALSNYVVPPTSNNSKIKQIFIKSGSFKVHLTSDILHNTSFILTFPSITNTLGEPLKLPMIIQPIPGNLTPADTTIEVSLNDNTIDFTDGGISYNVLPYMFELSLSKIPGNPAMVAGNKVTMTQTFTIDEYRGVNGYVGKFLLASLADTTTIESPPNQIDVSLKLNNPSLHFNIASGYGIPITIKINKISMTNKDGTEFPIRIKFLSDTFTLPAPTVLGSFAFGEYTISSANSNIDSIINNALQNAPRAINYDIQVFSNYNDIEVDNFMFDTSSLTVDVGMEIPLDLTISKFSYPFKDTLTWPDAETYELDTIMFFSEATNTLPLDIRLQAYFGKYNPAIVKDSFEIVDSLFQNGWQLSKALVDANGNVISHDKVYSYANLGKAKYNYLKDVAKCNMMKMDVSFATSKDAGNNQPSVKIYKHQSLGIRMGIKAKAKITSKNK